MYVAAKCLVTRYRTINSARDHSKYDQILRTKNSETIGFCVYRRSNLIRSPANRGYMATLWASPETRLQVGRVQEPIRAIRAKHGEGSKNASSSCACINCEAPHPYVVTPTAKTVRGY